MTGPVSVRSIERYVKVDTVADVCGLLDELEGTTAGELVFMAEGERRAGSVYVEDARICWAAADGLSRRLTELLVSYAAVDGETMEALFLRCKEERVPLGEYLVGRGIVRPEDLRDALARHTVESLAALAEPGRRAGWCPRPPPRAGYSPRFTFGTGEVLARSTAVLDEKMARLAATELAARFAEDEWAAAFVRSASSGAPAPIALHGQGPPTARDLVRVAKWAVSSLDVLAVCGAKNATLVVESPRPRPRHELFVAFCQGALVLAGETIAPCPARITHPRAPTLRPRG